MKDFFKRYLNAKSILVNDYDGKSENAFAALYSFGKLFGINITKGRELADERLLKDAAVLMGENVPEPFYRGFPESVRALSPDQIMFDRVVHYAKTYGFGMFDNPGHSIMEDFIGRTAFNEGTIIRDFSIITEKEAEKVIHDMVENFFLGTRPLSISNLKLVEEYIREYNYMPSVCASKNLAMMLILDLENVEFARFLSMSDVIKLAEEADYKALEKPWEKNGVREWKLNLKNRDRKIITAVINRLFESGRCNTVDCYEKKAKWSGLLHHIHYKPINPEAEEFVNLMRGRGNCSVYSVFEGLMASGKPVEAAKALLDGKGSGAVLRNLEYIVSRCEKDEQICKVLDLTDTDNIMILLQLVIKYGRNEEEKLPRHFAFTRHNLMTVHVEHDEEVEARKSFLSPERRELIKTYLTEQIQAKLKGRLGKVYIDYDMKLIALPIQENTSQGGFGVLPKGSRLPIPPGKKIRAFTYWEKVNDIDLSCFGLCDDGSQLEFSWRTFTKSSTDAISFSGDETSGFNGGSEYFDIVFSDFKEEFPNVHYIVFADNVYSMEPFSKCVCRAGYMMRSLQDSGEVFEPKTVNSSFTVNCESTQAFLFALDLRRREFVWLNMAEEGGRCVAGNDSMEFLKRYMEAVYTMNMHSFFTMLATEVVTDISEADIIVSDKPVKEGCKGEVIRSCDFDKIIALMR